MKRIAIMWVCNVVAVLLIATMKVEHIVLALIVAGFGLWLGASIEPGERE